MAKRQTRAAARKGPQGPAVSIGDWVMTPVGPGKVLALWAKQASVEMDFAYPVKFPLKALGPIGELVPEESPCAVCQTPTHYRCLDCGHPTCAMHAGHKRELG